eukprot:4912146-Amphidinium_carterae.1
MKRSKAFSGCFGFRAAVGSPMSCELVLKCLPIILRHTSFRTRSRSSYRSLLVVDASSHQF